MTIDPGYSRIKFKQDTTIEGYLFAAGIDQEFPDTVLEAHCGPLTGNAAFEVLENGHEQYNAARAAERAPVAIPAIDAKPASKKASK